MTKSILTSVVTVTLLLSVVLMALPLSASAACSYNGYINSGGKCSKSFKKDRKQYRYSSQTNHIDDRIEAMRAYIERLMDLIEMLDDSRDNSYDSDVDVLTRSAIDINEERATLRGRLDWNREDEAVVYFEYGRSASNLSEDTAEVNLDEDDDDEDFSRRITNLRKDTKYYFRAVAEDENGDRDYGSVLSFRTDDNSNDDEPSVDNDSATNITDSSARLRGSVDMNDLNNGVVFFVYGEDEDQVEDIEDDYDNYSDVDEDGDDLQKLLVDSNHNGDDDFSRTASGLDSDTRIYHAICVAYEDDDDEEEIICSNTNDFETDND